MREIELNEAAKKVIAELKEIYPDELKIKYHDKKAGFLRHDQAQQYLHDGKMVIEVNDVTEANYTVSHELLHLLLLFKGAPQISFNITTGSKELDNKIMATGMELYDTVLHFIVYRQQKERGLINEKVKELYFKGVLATLKPEPSDHTDEWMVLRTLTLLDTFVFFRDEEEHILPKLEKLYPRTFTAAQRIYKALTVKNISSAFEIRRAVVKVFRLFDQQLEQWKMSQMNLQNFVTLTVVLSKRQKRLEVRQLFSIFHSELHENLQDTTAYIGISKADQQNTFVLPTPRSKKTEDEFKRIYAMPVGEFMDELAIPYLTR
ncbi:IpaB/EvcA family protein [Liquorilactobacillus uvarum]|uniref:IpaB/EvcA family protein n=1 Tax=Liquorilactobacillus uvarum TaxID=303240 RepID=UPI002889FEE6|nr:IpaB/EvcA family protein [Liquorilactobacillus uvarum]